jgi:hypothetical protein
VGRGRELCSKVIGAARCLVHDIRNVAIVPNRTALRISNKTVGWPIVELMVVTRSN